MTLNPGGQEERSQRRGEEGEREGRCRCGCRPAVKEGASAENKQASKTDRQTEKDAVG